MSFLSNHPIFKIQCYNSEKVKKKKIPLIMDSKSFLDVLPSRETDNPENLESDHSIKKMKFNVTFSSLQVDTINYKKVVIKGNESESKAVAVPAFQGQSH